MQPSTRPIALADPWWGCAPSEPLTYLDLEGSEADEGEDEEGEMEIGMAFVVDDQASGSRLSHANKREVIGLDLGTQW